MDMYCLDGLGRDIWEWEVRDSAFWKYPQKGKGTSQMCVPVRVETGWPKDEMVVVVVVVVVVESDDFSKSNYC